MSLPPNQNIPEITAVELKDRLDSETTPVLVDVREPFERDIADLPEVGQLRIPLAEIGSRMGEVPRDREVVFYCRSGARSGTVVQYLQAQGFESAVNLRGGVLAWRADVDPSLTAY